VGFAIRFSPLDSPPSHIPSDGLLVGPTPERPRGPLLIFRKIHLYAKTKKSTHGHQTTKPFCTQFYNASSDYSSRSAEFNGGGLAGHRRLWRAGGRLEAGSRVGRPTLDRPTYPRPTDLPLDPSRPPTLYLPYTSPAFRQPSCLPQGQQRAAERPVQLSSLSCTRWHRLLRRPRPGAQVDLPDPSVRKFQPAIAHSPASQPAQDLASCNPDQKELP
jgi:hypothetical protein